MTVTELFLGSNEEQQKLNPPGIVRCKVPVKTENSSPNKMVCDKIWP